MNFRPTTAFLLLALMATTVFTACSSDNEEDENPAPVAGECGFAESDTLTYNDHIKSIVANSCLPGCHNASDAKAGLVLESYDQLRTAALDDNKIIKSVKGEGGYDRMPPIGSGLDDCDIARLENWVNKGLQED